MGVNNINSPLFATEAASIDADDTISSATKLNSSALFIGSGGNVNVIVAGVKKPGQLLAVEVLEGGSNYTTGTALAIVGGHGDNLGTVNIVAVGGEVTSATVNAKGSGYQINDIIFIDSGDGNAELKVTNVSDLPTAAEAVQFKNLSSGCFLPVIVDYVLATDTTAADIIAIN